SRAPRGIPTVFKELNLQHGVAEETSLIHILAVPGAQARSTRLGFLSVSVSPYLRGEKLPFTNKNARHR
ncbi:MAG TPA: hypothetical protein VFR08_12930, partial [Candidatus Angelobacter sp.]|nr:hypothetical protein [Candidatus Angelobacter sp.]